MSKQRTYYVYIVTNKNHTVLYTGFTGNITQRLEQHQNGEGEGFTAKYKAHKLVYLESFGEVHQAIAWEKKIKAGSRKKKELLINEQNPEWRDLSESY